MLRATLNEPVPLQVLASDGRTDLFAQALVYQGATLLTTLSLPHLDTGLYGASYTPTAEGYLSVVYKLFYDNAFTIPADYDFESETLEIDTFKTNLLRILGLLHHNAVLDQQVFTPDGQLSTARLRSYDSVLNAQAGGLTGLLFTWHVVAEYTSGRVSRFSIEEVP